MTESKLVFIRRPEYRTRDEPPKTFSYTCTIYGPSLADLTFDDFLTDSEYVLSLRLQTTTPLYDIPQRESKKLVQWVKTIYRKQKDGAFITLKPTGTASFVTTMDRVDIYQKVNDTWYEWCSFIYPTIHIYTHSGVGVLDIESSFLYTTPNFWSTQNGMPLQPTSFFPQPHSPQFDEQTARQARAAWCDAFFTVQEDE